MMATPHLLTGAAVGVALCKHPRLALPAAFATHFVLDATPHLDSNDLYGSPVGATVPEVGIAVVDFVLGCMVVIALSRGQPWLRMALWGAFSAIVLDLVTVIPPIGHWFAAWPGTAWLDRFHHGIQPYVPPDNLLLGFGTQAAVIAAMVWLLWRRRGIRALPVDRSDRVSRQEPRPLSGR